MHLCRSFFSHLTENLFSLIGMPAQNLGETSWMNSPDSLVVVRVICFARAILNPSRHLIHKVSCLWHRSSLVSLKCWHLLSWLLLICSIEAERSPAPGKCLWDTMCSIWFWFDCVLQGAMHWETGSPCGVGSGWYAYWWVTTDFSLTLCLDLRFSLT